MYMLGTKFNDIGLVSLLFQRLAQLYCINFIESCLWTFVTIPISPFVIQRIFSLLFAIASAIIHL